MKPTKSTWMVLALLLTVVASCGSGRADQQQVPPEAVETPAATNEASTLEVPAVPDAAIGDGLVGAWILIAIDGEPVPEVGKQPTMEISEDGTASGVGGINRYSTQLEVTDGRLAFGPTAATKMAGPPEAMDLESAFFTRLGAVTNYQVDGETLRMWAGDDEALTFKRGED